jgi:hypothetical protein
MANAAMAWLMLVAAVSAAQFDMAAVAKWQAAKVVHYQITGTFRGTTPLQTGVASSYAEIEVIDKVTLELDWDNRGSAVVGEARFTNAPSQVVKASSAKAECPPPRVKGAYEHLEVASAGPYSGGIELKGTRSYPAADISSEWPSTCATKPVAAGQEAVTEYVAVPSPMLLVMPAGANPNLTVSADKKSFTIKGNTWSWTYTPTIVK